MTEIHPFETRLHIDGEWRAASDGRTLDVFDPSSRRVLATVASATVSDALDAVSSAHAALTSWSARAPRERSEILRSAFQIMVSRREQLARLIVLENGKAWRDALSEVDYAAEFFRWYAEEAVRAIGEISRAPGGGNRIIVSLQPVGVSLLVTPWNFPAAMATRKIGPALAAGCSVILKPASDTPLTALAIAQILAEAGVPRGVVNVIPSATSGKVCGALLNDARVRKLSFTGSTEVGRLLLAQAAANVVNCSMELGGNAPFIVLDDADLDAAVRGAMIAKMRNGGQACTAANRFYVHRSVLAEFSERMIGAMGQLKMGSGLDPAMELGPLINASACDRVQQLVDDAVGSGARLLLGGKRQSEPGCFYPPTVLDHVPHDARIVQEEIFGPVAPILSFEHEDEAIELANDTQYGLVSYLYTRDLRRGLRLSERLESGMVGLNRGLVSDPGAPFGGMKQSGIGREGAHDGLLEFCEKKYIAVEY
ncbi:NAD-dependent succinate-semialdehyde dehydrogenase [Peristeroidobacter agariperforans]|uniref:NAD-dependent succinate-semialdehyde dehydrogenase n=1 Tax=Peristeroidobacter agariperforans TaxID=268404 RepID=UPI00101B9961|nr:NAD-dependent succinate-semialdehyde dehydrogenase [Peristeroidobacter agariperforans]